MVSPIKEVSPSDHVWVPQAFGVEMNEWGWDIHPVTFSDCQAS